MWWTERTKQHHTDTRTFFCTSKFHAKERSSHVVFLYCQVSLSRWPTSSQSHNITHLSSASFSAAEYCRSALLKKVVTPSRTSRLCPWQASTAQSNTNQFKRWRKACRASVQRVIFFWDFVGLVGQRLFGLAARNRLSLSLPLSFSPSSYFLSFSIQKPDSKTKRPSWARFNPRTLNLCSWYSSYLGWTTGIKEWSSTFDWKLTRFASILKLIYNRFAVANKGDFYF